MSEHEGIFSGVLSLVGNAGAWWRRQAEQMERQRDAAFADLAAANERADALAVENAELRAAMQRLVDVDMGLRDRIGRYLPDGPGMVLAVRGILVVQAATNMLATPAPERGAAILEAAQRMADLVVEYGHQTIPLVRLWDAADRYRALVAPSHGGEDAET